MYVCIHTWNNGLRMHACVSSRHIRISDCAGLRQRADRGMMIKLIGGTAAFQIETGRWHGVVREDRVCKECGKGEVEDVEQWLLRCEKWKTHRQPLIAMVQEHYEVDQVCGMRDLIELLAQYL